MFLYCHWMNCHWPLVKAGCSKLYRVENQHIAIFTRYTKCPCCRMMNRCRNCCWHLLMWNKVSKPIEVPLACRRCLTSTGQRVPLCFWQQYCCSACQLPEFLILRWQGGAKEDAADGDHGHDQSVLYTQPFSFGVCLLFCFFSLLFFFFSHFWYFVWTQSKLILSWGSSNCECLLIFGPEWTFKFKKYFLTLLPLKECQ